jgi:Family of unknown function (DUF5713)
MFGYATSAKAGQAFLMALSRNAIVAWTASVVGLFSVVSCSRVSLSNAQVNNHAFLQCMYEDDSFPKHLVDDLGEELYEANSEIETSAAECIAEDFAFIAEAYGFVDADLEELIATRLW